MSSLSILSAALALLASAGADPVANDRVTAPVFIGDLDLSSLAGQQTAKKRIRATAGRLCGVAVQRPLNERSSILTCHDEVIASGESKLGHRFAGTDAAHLQASSR